MQGEDGLPGIQGPPALPGFEVKSKLIILCLMLITTAEVCFFFVFNDSDFDICASSVSFAGASWRDWASGSPRSDRGYCKFVAVHNKETLQMMKSYFYFHFCLVR